MTRFPSLLTSSLVVLFCWLLAQWTWIALTPIVQFTQVYKHENLDHDSTDIVLAGNLFGSFKEDSLISVTHSFSTNLNLKLHGVFAAIGSMPALAIISVNGMPDQPFIDGAEIDHGLVLKGVYSEYVEIYRNGALERLELDRKSSAKNVSLDSNEFKLNVRSQGNGFYSLSRRELSLALQNPRQLSNLGDLKMNPQGAGLSVSLVPKGSLVEKLGLMQGDLILNVNGKPVTGIDIVSKLYQQVNELGNVRLRGMRNGHVLDLNYTVT